MRQRMAYKSVRRGDYVAAEYTRTTAEFALLFLSLEPDDH